METTDCVFVGDLTINQLENLDQSVEIFVIVLFFITSALFIASCINNYQNERREKLRRRIAQQQTMSLFAEQRRRMDLSSSASITEVVSLSSDNLYTNHNHSLRNGSSRHSTRNQNRHYRYMDMDYNLKSGAYDDLPPSYEECIRMKNEETKLHSNHTNPLDPLANSLNNIQQINFAIIEQEHQNSSLTDVNNAIDINSSTASNHQTDQCCISSPPIVCNNHFDNQMNHNVDHNTMNHNIDHNMTSNTTNNTMSNTMNHNVEHNNTNMNNLNDNSSGDNTCRINETNNNDLNNNQATCK